MFETRLSLGWLIFIVGAVGCGSTPSSTVELPSDTEVQNLYALGPGSCWRYRYSSGGIDAFAQADLLPQDLSSVSGKTLYPWSFRPENRTTADEWFYELGGSGVVQTPRVDVDGQQKFYEETIPAFPAAEYDDEGAVVLAVGARTDATVTPNVCDGGCGPGQEEVHSISVLEQTDLTTPDGLLPGYRIQYRINSTNQIFSLVPGFGFAQYASGTGTVYQVCAARVCDADGTCTGASSCEYATLNAICTQ